LLQYKGGGRKGQGPAEDQKERQETGDKQGGGGGGAPVPCISTKKKKKKEKKPSLRPLSFHEQGKKEKRKGRDGSLAKGMTTLSGGQKEDQKKGGGSIACSEEKSKRGPQRLPSGKKKRDACVRAPPFLP